MSSAAILRTANQHAELTASFEQLRDAPARLEMVRTDIAHFEATINEHKELQKAKAALVSAQSELAEMQSSSATKITYALIGRKGKFEEKLRKRETKCADALRAREEANNRHESAAQLLVQAQGARTSLLKDVERLSLVQSKLDALYESVFLLPNPEFPAEVAAREQIGISMRAANDLNARLAADNRVLELLSFSESRMTSLLQELNVFIAPYRASMTSSQRCKMGVWL